MTHHQVGPAAPSQALLRAQGVSFRYRSSQEDVLAGVDLPVAPRALTALTGPSGSGKSTLLYLLALMLRPSSGEVWLGGQATSGMLDHERAALRAHRYGFVFQDASLDPTRTVLDNVVETALYRDEDRAVALIRGRELLEQFGVGHRAAHRPGEISGGQAQRIALCRALLHQPDVVVADEPTGNLDAASTEVVLQALRDEAQRGATVVIATHEAHVVAACDQRVDLGGWSG